MAPGPVMSRRLSRQRAEQAARLRATGMTWQEVADAVGYRSRQGAFDAVAALYKRFPPESPETARRSLTEGLRIQLARLHQRFADAEDRNDTEAVVALAKELRSTTDAIAKLNGLSVPVAQQVDVNVHHSATAIIDRMETELLALAAQRQPQFAIGAVIEGEVIEG